jgi:hypothetical protein
MACSSDAKSDPGLDLGQDTSQDSQNDIADAQMEPDVIEIPRTCRTIYECPRGTSCGGPEIGCYATTGCGPIWDPSPEDDYGCLFDHDMDPSRTAGIFTAKECDTDAECADSPYGPFCVERVCHADGPCETNDDCDPGYVCVLSVICVDAARVSP